jgi:hypothetical protein
MVLCTICPTLSIAQISIGVRPGHEEAIEEGLESTSAALTTW